MALNDKAECSSLTSVKNDSDSCLFMDVEESDVVDDSPKDSLKSLLKDEDTSEGTVDCVSLNGKICGKVDCGDASGLLNQGLNCVDVMKLMLGFTILLIAIVSFVFTPQDFMLWEKLNMRPGLPPYEWWSDPPDEVVMSIYLFNVTNHDAFMKGTENKINLQEIGPIVYREKLSHYNIMFNANSTMTYTARRTPIFMDDRNVINFNDTIIVPNLALLGLASYLYNSPFFIKAMYRMMANSHKSQFFTKLTIWEYLWDYRHPILHTSNTIAPGLVPVDNMGMLHRMYEDFTDNVTVFIGPDWGHKKFFQLDKFRGQPQLPGFNPETCPDRISGSTEGVMYSQRLTKDDVLLYWRKSVCKLMPLYFDKELIVDSIPVNRYNLSEQVFDRLKNGTDCYDTIPPLISGLSDASKCYFDFPMVISYPHFYTETPAHDTYVTGLKPDRNKHNSYAVVEPKTGTPMHSVARMQSNLRVLNLSGFGGEYDRFSGLVLPMFWAEYNQEGLPGYIKNTLYFTVVILPPFQAIISFCGTILSIYIIFNILYKYRLKKTNLSQIIGRLKCNKSNFDIDNTKKRVI